MCSLSCRETIGAGGGGDKVIRQEEDKVKQIVTCAVCVSGKPVGDDKVMKQEEDKVKQIVKKVRR